MKGGQNPAKTAGFRTNPYPGDSLLTVDDAERNTTNMLVFDT